MALPDAARLVRSGRRPGEPTFPVFYQVQVYLAFLDFMSSIMQIKCHFYICQVQAALGKSSLYLPPRELVSNAFFTPLQVKFQY